MEWSSRDDAILGTPAFQGVPGTRAALGKAGESHFFHQSTGPGQWPSCPGLRGYWPQPQTLFQISNLSEVMHFPVYNHPLVQPLAHSYIFISQWYKSTYVHILYICLSAYYVSVFLSSLQWATAAKCYEGALTTARPSLSWGKRATGWGKVATKGHFFSNPI